MATKKTSELDAIASNKITGAAAWVDDADGATKKHGISKTGTAGDADSLVSRDASGAIAGAFFYTEQGTTSAATATFTTLFSLPDAGLFLIVQWIPSSGATYQVSAIVTWDGSFGTLTKLSTGANGDMQLSGDAVQGKQSSGSTADIHWAYIRVA